MSIYHFGVVWPSLSWIWRLQYDSYLPLLSNGYYPVPCWSHSKRQLLCSFGGSQHGQHRNHAKTPNIDMEVVSREDISLEGYMV